MHRNYRSFADPDTEYYLLKERRSVGNGGLTAIIPTGEVMCGGTCDDGSLCQAVHTNIDDLPHESDCDQRHAHSWFYLKHALDGRCGGVLADEDPSISPVADAALAAGD